MGCEEDINHTENDKDSISVVTTIFPVADITANIGGDKVTVNHLLPQGASPHTFEPTVEEIKKLAEADIFIYVGGWLDDWAARMTNAASDELITVELTSDLHLLETTHVHKIDEQNYCSDYNCGEQHGPDDPHIWLDPLLVRDDVLPLISEALIKIAPGKKTLFREQQADYARQLTVLHEELKQQTSQLSRNEFIAFHPAWQYFAKQYDLVEAAVIARFPGQEPSAYWIAELINIVNEVGTRVIFSEPQLNQAIATQIANEIDGEVITIDPLGGKDLEGRNTYIDLMLYNMNSLEKALK